MTLYNGNYFLALLPILFFLILFILFLQNFEWRESFLLSSVIWGATVVAITEGLSIFNQLTYLSLSISWIIFNILAGLILLNKVIKADLKQIKLKFPRLERFEYFVIASILIIILITWVIALVSPPNSFDSMNYHMSRIMHWIQDRNVEPYPTNITFQTDWTPGSEYEILQFQLLSGGDHLANMVDWFSFIGSIIGVSLIARELGADRKGQLLSAAFCAAIPMAILQASSSLNHLTTAFWLVGFAYFALHAFNLPRSLDIISISLSLGLSIFSKSTAYIFAFPFVIFIVLWVLFSKERNRIWLWFVTAVIVLAINSGQYIRNYLSYKDPLGSPRNYGYFNEIYTPASITSNIIRNIALHIQTPSKRFNNYLDGIILKTHEYIGISEDDPRTTWAASLHFYITPNLFYEDNAGNPIHLLLIIGTFGYCFVFLKRTPRLILYYILALMGGFLLFCTLLKWQDWNSRFHLPLFVLASAILGTTIAKIRPKYISNAIVLLFLVAATPWVIAGQPRSLIGSTNIFDVSRNEQYFAARPEKYLPYALAVQQINKMQVSSIGISMGLSQYEYPLWALLSQSYRPLPCIEHVDVHNETNKLTNLGCAYPSFSPDVIVVTIPALIAKDTYNIDNKIYQRVWQSTDQIALYVPVKP